MTEKSNRSKSAAERGASAESALRQLFGEDIHEPALCSFCRVKAFEWGAFCAQCGWYRGALLHPFFRDRQRFFILGNVALFLGADCAILITN